MPRRSTERERRKHERDRRKARSAHRVLAQKARMVREAGGELHCHICGRPIDLDMPARHPLSFELDHVDPVSRHGTPEYANTAPSHRRCNQVRGNGSVADARARLRGERVPVAPDIEPLPSLAALAPSPTTHGYWTDQRGRIYAKGTGGGTQPQSREW